MSTQSFAHLHCHSHYSLLDGASSIDRLVARTVELGMNSLAITDHGNLHGALEFLRGRQGGEDQPDHRLRGLHRPGQPVSEGCRQPAGFELPPHAPRPRPRRLRQPAEVGHEGLPRGLLLQAPHRPRTPPGIRRGADLPVGLSLGRVQPGTRGVVPRAAGVARAGPRGGRLVPERPSATVTSSRSRTTASTSSGR